MDTYCGYIFGGKLGGAERALTMLTNNPAVKPATEITLSPAPSNSDP
jgi:hypothetical protein